MTAIARQQEQMRDAVQNTMGSLLPPKLEEIRRQNMAMVERAMSLFTPFYRPPEPEPPPQVAPEADELAALREEVAALRAQLADQRAKPPRKA
jgi:polyhydroxyalkanoate synthesis regulator protein